MSNRPQQVKLDDNYSIEHINYFSVPQGTVLEPLLFITYINGLLNINLDADIFWYTHDTIIPVKYKYYSYLFNLANKCTSSVKVWCDNNYN